MVRILLLLILLYPSELLAASIETSNLFIAGMKMFVGTVAVVGLMVLVYVLNRRGFQFLKAKKAGRINIVEIRPIGGRKMLCLIEVKGQEFLLGMGNERIDFLYHFSDGHAGCGFENELMEHAEVER